MKKTLHVIEDEKNSYYPDMVGKTYKITEVVRDPDKSIKVIMEEVCAFSGTRNGIEFTKEQISEMVRKRKEGYSLYQLAAEYQCSRTPIRRVLEENMDSGGSGKKRNNVSSQISEEEKKAIWSKRNNGYTYQKLADEYGCTPQGIKYVCDKMKRLKENSDKL